MSYKLRSWPIGIIFGSYVFLFSYGLPSFTGNVRLSDLAVLTAFILAVCYITVAGKVSKPRLSAALLTLFLLASMDMLLPLALVGQDGWVEGAQSTVRAAIFWLPPLVAVAICPEDEAWSVINKIIKIGLLVHTFSAVLEFLHFYEIVPDLANFRLWFSDFAIDNTVYRYERIWSAGLFVNSTMLASFGVVSLSIFLAKFTKGDRDKSDVIFIILSVLCIVLSTSRTALFAAAIIMLISLLYFKMGRLILFLSTFLVLLFGQLIISMLSKIEIFDRYTRLLDDGLSGDYSFGMRLVEIWPRVLLDFELYGPSWTNPVRVYGLIDSGYLSYYVQGGWPMLLSIILLLLFGLFSPFLQVLFKREFRYSDALQIFFFIYLSSSLLVANPLRNGIVATAIVLLLYVRRTKSADKGTQL